MKRQALALFCTASVFVGLGVAVPLLMSPSPARSNDKQHEKEEIANFKEMHLVCPKCQGPMEFGMPLYYSEASYWQSEWAVGEQGKTPFAKSVPRKKIVSFRCTNCGYLESYAK